MTHAWSALFDDIRAGAVARELDRELARDAVTALRDTGFGALRVPPEFGGGGVSLEEFFELFVELAAADSNVAHLLRGHFAFVEMLLLRAPSDYRDGWFRAVAGGALVGNASSETTGNALSDISTTLVESEGRLLLNGRKFYSTGTLYCSHVFVAAGLDGTRVNVVVPTDAPGVTMIDDWDGIGQRLTASGTTVFDDVEVDPATITPYGGGGASHIPAYFQLILVAVAAGIAQAILDDVVAYVRPRERTFVNANADAPRDDPQVKAVIGRLSSIAFTARAAVLAAAHETAVAIDSLELGTGLDPDLVDAAEVAVYQAQVHVLDDVLHAASHAFEVGGASIASRSAAFDRHWRNARTVASHNPAIYKLKQLGEWELSGTGPNDMWRGLWTIGATRVE